MSFRRFALWSAAALVLLLLIAAAALFWASRSETVLRWGIDRAAGSLPCSLTVQGLRGSLVGPVQVQYLACENDDYRVEARNTELEWSPMLLAARRLEINRLGIAQLRYTSKTTTAPADAPQPLQPPQQLRLPIAISIDNLDVGSVVIATAEQTVELRAIRAGYQGDSRSHRLTLANLESDWGRASGEATIGTTAPLPLAARLSVATDRFADWPISAGIELSGQLQTMVATVQAAAGKLNVTGRLQLAPFDAAPVKAITARAGNIDAAAFDARLPHTALTATIEATPVNMSALTGELRAENAIPGQLDQQKLPLRSLAANFDLDAASLRLSGLRLDLGAAGSASGAAQLGKDRITLALQVNKLDLRAIRSDLRGTALNGSISVERRDDTQLVALDLREKDMQLEAKGEVTAQRVVVERMTARAGGAQLRASATVALNEQFDFSLDGTLAAFDPARFGEFPQADINASLRMRGMVRPAWRSEIDFRLSRSRFRGAPLSGAGKFTLMPSRLQAANVRLDYGGNDLQLRGDFGNKGDSIAFVLDAKRLDRLDATLGGKLQAQGKLGGTPQRPAIDADVKAQQLAYAGMRAEKAQLRVSVAQADDPVIRAQAKLQQVSRGEIALDTLDAAIDGTLANHSLQLAAAAPALQLQARVNGGWDGARQVWSGKLAQLQNAGEYAFTMQQPASLELARDRIVIGATKVEFSQTEIALGQTRFDDSGLQTQGTITGVRAARVLALLKQPPAIESTLVLNARWDIRAARAVDGFVELSRSSGDIVIPGEEPLAVGLEELRVTVRAAASQLTAQAIVRSAQADARGTAKTRLEKRGTRWGVPGTAPLSLDANLEMKSIRPLVALASRSVTGDGKLTLSMTARGTVAERKLSGTVEGRDLKVEQVANGVFFRDGTLRASFTDNALTLTEFKIKAGQGEFDARGRFSAAKGAPTMDLQWTARKLAVVQHPDLRLTVSGAGQLAYRQAIFSLKGELAADQGRVELRRRTAPSLGDDVVVTGREQRKQLSSETRRANLDLLLDLGPDFTVVGRGLDARMAGKIRLTSSVDKPLSADGEIRVASGTYEAYGRRLQIEQGVLYFSGPVNNPGLNIRAMRKNQQVEAGVQITGTARDPNVQLVSDPEVSDPNKLAWLVLGRPAEANNTLDNQALQNSAAALAAGLGTSPFQRQLASAVGVDEISFAPAAGESQGGVVTVGKQISDRIYVSQEFGVSAAGNTLRVSYQLSRRWSLRTESGETDAVDIFFTFSFD